MSEEGSKGKHQLPDADNDFGLPKVEITPIRDDTKPVPSPQREQKEGTPPARPDGDEPADTEPVRGEPTDAPSKEAKSSGLNWLIILLFLLALIAGGWFYFSNQQAVEQEKPEASKVPEEIVTPSVPEPVEEEEAGASEKMEEAFTLTEITSREERPRYFLVVASFIDEDMARDHSDLLLKQGRNTFLVHPYGEIAYYRLAIGQFTSFALASEEISRVKDDFEENLWVLKY